MSEDGAALSFERAEYESGSDATPCGECQQPLVGEYWRLQQSLLCERCRKRVEQTVANAQSMKVFGKAALLGGLTALGCGIAYAVFVAWTNMQLALATIGIAFAIAKVVRRASLGIGGLRYQVLAVALTYGASAMGYAPAIFHGLEGSDESADHAQSDKAGDESAASSANKTSPGQATAGEVAFAFATIFAVMLAAPFLAFTDAPMGFLIVLFGLWEAWKLLSPAPTTLEGPFRVASAAAKPGFEQTTTSEATGA